MGAKGEESLPEGARGMIAATRSASRPRRPILSCYRGTGAWPKLATVPTVTGENDGIGNGHNHGQGLFSRTRSGAFFLSLFRYAGNRQHFADRTQVRIRIILTAREVQSGVSAYVGQVFVNRAL